MNNQRPPRGTILSFLPLDLIPEGMFVKRKNNRFVGAMPTGETGPKGDQGDIGLQGPQGPKGDAGDTGATGNQGLQGEHGYTGDTGPQGAKGDTGDQGIQGIQGAQGLTGNTGPQGDQGIQGVQGEPGTQGIQGVKGDTGDPGTTTWAGITDKPTVFPPDTHGHAPSEITGTAVITTDSRLSDARTPTSHAHSPSDVTGTAVITNDSRLSDARTPTTHDQAISTITGLQTALDGKSATGHGHAIANTTNLQTTLDGKSSTSHDHSGAYEPANANIQNHIASGHAPSNAQKNSDITKGEIEAKLTGEISSHTHAGGAGGNGYCIQGSAANQSTTTDSQTLYWGNIPLAPTTTAGNTRIYIPKAGTIKAAYVFVHSATAGSAENWSMNIRVNNSADTLIQSLASSSSQRVWSNASLSVVVALGDYIEIKEVQSAWVTNPANVRRSFILYIE